jgi:hypothetical protein
MLGLIGHLRPWPASESDHYLDFKTYEIRNLMLSLTQAKNPNFDPLHAMALLP